MAKTPIPRSKFVAILPFSQINSSARKKTGLASEKTYFWGVADYLYIGAYSTIKNISIHVHNKIMMCRYAKTEGNLAAGREIFLGKNAIAEEGCCSYGKLIIGNEAITGADNFAGEFMLIQKRAKTKINISDGLIDVNGGQTTKNIGKSILVRNGGKTGNNVADGEIIVEAGCSTGKNHAYSKRLDKMS